jgi:tRNASer (uridine44-2'-O)-methyltransferase
MGRKPPVVRDASKLSQKPLSETVIPSVNIILNNKGFDDGEKVSDDSDGSSRNNEDSGHHDDKSFTDNETLADWMTSRDLVEKGLFFTQDVMYNLNNFLLGNPNMNSSQLFRADILFDSAGELKTPKEREALQFGTGAVSHGAIETGGASAQGSTIEDGSTTSKDNEKVEPETAPQIPGFILKRTVVRKLIPRNLKVDKPLNQTCHYYEGIEGEDSDTAVERTLYISLPHIKSVEDVPFYHPRVRGVAFLYDYQRGLSSIQEQPNTQQAPGKEENKTEQTPGPGALSVHFLPFPAAEDFDPFPTRLERTLQNLLSTHIRLARNTHPTKTTGTGAPSASDLQHNATKKHEDDSYNPDKDNIIPRHMVQDTYSRLKMTYSRDLCQRWIENTEPSKHVFEDLLITAFLIELWRNMYGVVPKAEREKEQKQSDGEDGNAKTLFAGFVDIACGNGVLVYVLLMEGYQGWGFDARHRKTWSIFPEWIQDKLKESIYIPKPFVDEFVAVEEGEINPLSQFTNQNGKGTIQYTTADFPPNTFVISNHADELTVWTPLLAALACPESPLPFLSIPCCSHALSGARFRYPAPKKVSSKSVAAAEGNDNNKTGDLKALRAEKQAASTSNGSNATAVVNSMYGSLTAKTMSVAEEIGYGVEKTLLRIPSTRNMGVLGGRIDTIRKWQGNNASDGQGQEDTSLSTNADTVLQRVTEIVERECAAREGSVQAAAKIWIEGAVKLQKKKGKNS